MKALHGLVCAALLALLGCPAEQGAKPAPAGAAPTTTSTLEVPTGTVAELWERECTRCHGDLGDGDGEIVKSLREWPRDFTDPKWQASIDDKKLKAVIVGGGPAVGLSTEMPDFPQLKGQDEQLDALVAHIRGLVKPTTPVEATEQKE